MNDKFYAELDRIYSKYATVNFQHVAPEQADSDVLMNFALHDVLGLEPIYFNWEQHMQCIEAGNPVALENAQDGIKYIRVMQQRRKDEEPEYAYAFKLLYIAYYIFVYRKLILKCSDGDKEVAAMKTWINLCSATKPPLCFMVSIK